MNDTTETKHSTDDGREWGYINPTGAWERVPKTPMLLANLGPPPFDVTLPHTGEVRRIVHNPAEGAVGPGTADIPPRAPDAASGLLGGSAGAVIAVVPPPPRPRVLDGRTYKIKWPVTDVNWYVTVTNDGRRVRELFITGGDPETREWAEALARSVTAVFRRDGDARFLAEELTRVSSARGGAFVDGVYRPSVVAAIGGVLTTEIERMAEKDRFARRAEAFAAARGVDISTGGPSVEPFAVNAKQEAWTAVPNGKTSNAE
jgi:hypothetical protein